MIRRYGQPPEAGRRYILRPGVYAILPRYGQLLLTHQSRPHPELQLPGGGIDPGEHPIAALHREVFEETGWHIGNPRRLGAFRRFTFMPEYDIWAEKLCIIYRALPVRPHADPIEPDHRVQWATPEEAAQWLGNPGDRAFVARYCRQ
ncbi:NUDIX domain-containing protein [Primorskyibacter sp. 2E107]|uniref:NUDIX domain-containing protein n=1 Tax=Primorskyibacter sp. 2E107 TaxID=3403458 RepID=UPI003AF5DAB6